MAFCGKCGTQLHENATFCANCGTPTGVSGQPPAAGGAPVVAHPAMPPAATPSRGFFGSLFDLSFSNFVTVRVVKVLFVLGIIGVVLGAIFVMASASELRGVQVPPGVIIIAAPIAAFLYILLIRIYMEILTVTFRMAEYLRELVEQGRNRGQ